MDLPLRIRMVNAMLYIGIFFMYMVYDNSFRFWMAQSDTLTLRAAILHDDVALKTAGGEPGLAFDAAADVTTTPALQTYFHVSQHWSRVPSATTEATAQDKGGHVKSKILPLRVVKSSVKNPTRPRAATAARATLPMAAVVVESSWLAPNRTSVSHAYAQRLLEGFRYALLTGAPWLLLAGTAEETAIALQHLRELENPAEVLFGGAITARYAAGLTEVAAALHDSMRAYATLGEWMHAAGTRPLPAFAGASLPSSSAAEADAWASSAEATGVQASTTPSLRFALLHHLSINSLRNEESEQERSASLMLGAGWLRRVDEAYLKSLSTTAAAAAASPSAWEASTAPAEASTLTHEERRDVTEPRVTVYTDDPPERSRANLALPDTWEAPRLCVFHLSGTPQRVHVTIPGMVAVVAPADNRRAQHVAQALQRLLERTLVRRHALYGGAAAEERLADDAQMTPTESDTAEAAAGALPSWWWWLGDSYGVTIVSGGWEQLRVKLLYLKALREAAAATQSSVRHAVQEIHHTRCQFEGSRATSPLCQGRRSAQLPRNLLPFAAATPSPPKVFVLPPAEDAPPDDEPPPMWLNYTGELPLDTDPDASYVARVIGRWSYYYYVNYRRWMDWLLALLPGDAYQDHFVLCTVLMSDLADHRITLQDVFYAR